MTQFFDVYGPFDIARANGEIERSQSDFWADVEAWDEDLPGAIGCYVFCLKHGKTVRPWYVGKTLAQSGFRSETFTDHKLRLYNDSSIRSKPGQRQIFLFPMMTGSVDDAGRFSRNRSAGLRVIDWLEKTLIGMALQRNPALLNIKDATLPRSVTVRGILGDACRGRPYSEVQDARRVFFGR